jgi:hypothetical protein
MQFPYNAKDFNHDAWQHQKMTFLSSSGEGTDGETDYDPGR